LQTGNLFKNNPYELTEHLLEEVRLKKAHLTVGMINLLSNAKETLYDEFAKDFIY
jgi:hypothetical protein